MTTEKEGRLPCGHREKTGVEYRGTSEDYDGVSEWICNVCGKRFGRWTQRELLAGELERPNGRWA